MCTAVLKTNKLYENAVLVKQHSHPDEQCHQSMKHKASTINQIFTFSAATAPNEVKARLPVADTNLHALAVKVTAYKTITLCSVYLPHSNHFNFNPKYLQDVID